MPILYPRTQAPKNVLIAQTTTGLTQAKTFAELPYGNFNLGLHVHDNPVSVQQNRMQLLAALSQYSQGWVKQIRWLNQVHGNTVVVVDEHPQGKTPQADAMITQNKHVALAIMTADCVPVVLTNAQGNAIAAIHAGWQGLANGVIAKTIQRMRDMQLAPHYAWVGACISQPNYEVDARVKIALPDYAAYFKPSRANHYLADLPQIAQAQLQKNGINIVELSGYCSYTDARFYSYRRQTHMKQANTGRMATLIFMTSA